MFFSKPEKLSYEVLNGNRRYTDKQVQKGTIPARFVTTSLVTKRAGIAARFVTLVTP